MAYVAKLLSIKNDPSFADFYEVAAMRDLVVHNNCVANSLYIETLVTLIRKNRDWQEQQARKLLLEVFEALGHGHPLTLSGRRKLSAVLFS